MTAAPDTIIETIVAMMTWDPIFSSFCSADILCTLLDPEARGRRYALVCRSSRREASSTRSKPRQGIKWTLHCALILSRRVDWGQRAKTNDVRSHILTCRNSRVRGSCNATQRFIPRPQFPLGRGVTFCDMRMWLQAQDGTSNPHWPWDTLQW